MCAPPYARFVICGSRACTDMPAVRACAHANTLTPARMCTHERARTHTHNFARKIVELAAEAAAMQQKVRDRDEEIRSWRAYLARAAQAQTDVQMQTEDVGREAEGREALVPLCDKDSKAACNSSATRGGLEAEVQEYKDTVRLLEVQLAATREILALQDRWLVSAGAVSVVNPPARPTADLGSSILTEAGGEVDLAEGGEMWGDAVEAEFAGEAEVVGEKILNEWRQQVYVLLLEQASHEAEHTKKVAALNQNLSHLEHQVPDPCVPVHFVDMHERAQGRERAHNPQCFPEQ